MKGLNITKNKHLTNRAGKDYRPKEENPKHIFFFKGRYIMISEDYQSVWILTKDSDFSTHNNSLDDSLVQGMEEVYSINEKDYDREIEEKTKKEEEAAIRKQLEPYIEVIVKAIMSK
jgi:hypothetical protein